MVKPDRRNDIAGKREHFIIKSNKMPKPIYDLVIHVEALQEAVERDGLETITRDLRDGFVKAVETASELDGGDYEVTSNLFEGEEELDDE